MVRDRGAALKLSHVTGAANLWMDAGLTVRGDGRSSQMAILIRGLESPFSRSICARGHKSDYFGTPPCPKFRRAAKFQWRCTAGLVEDEPLTEAEKALIEARLAAYEKDPDAGGSWEAGVSAFANDGGRVLTAPP